jgi:hypothetical protein
VPASDTTLKLGLDGGKYKEPGLIDIDTANDSRARLAQVPAAFAAWFLTG